MCRYDLDGVIPTHDPVSRIKFLKPNTYDQSDFTLCQRPADRWVFCLLPIKKSVLFCQLNHRSVAIQAA